LSFGFGTGLSQIAPGTFGTLIGFPLYYLIFDLNQNYQLTILGLLFIGGIVLCHITGNELGVADHPGIVVDEYICFAFVLVFTPPTMMWWMISFVTFRFFDIVKPWPASWIDKNMKNGWGVMLDDLVAALFTIGFLMMANYFFKS
jgi:phosphatidylglycerophosphatase A